MVIILIVKFLSTNKRIVERQQKIDKIENKITLFLKENDLPSIKNLIEELDIKCPISGTCNWTDVRQFNLMFKTQVGANQDTSSDLFLRPETAQGIFVNYLNVQKTTRLKLPFGVAQIGKAFRNEIIARQFILECESLNKWKCNFFVKPGEEMIWYDYWKKVVCFGINH